MALHFDNAIAVARYLSAHEKVEWVSYAGLEGDRYHALAKKYFKGRPSSLLTFGIKGGLDAGAKFYDPLKMVKRLVNIGDTNTLACHLIGRESCRERVWLYVWITVVDVS